MQVCILRHRSRIFNNSWLAHHLRRRLWWNLILKIEIDRFRAFEADTFYVVVSLVYYWRHFYLLSVSQVLGDPLFWLMNRLFSTFLDQRRWFQSVLQDGLDLLLLSHLIWRWRRSFEGVLFVNYSICWNRWSWGRWG